MNRKSKAKHTPGKWREYDGDIVSESDIKGDIVCSAPLGFPKSMKRWEANARLIAEAPTMYEAIQEFCDRVERGEVRSRRTYAKFKELIKKIEG